MEKPLKEIINFEKVGKRNIKIFINFLLENGYYLTYFEQEIPSLCGTINFAEDLSRNLAWYKYLTQANDKYVYELWDGIVYDIASKDPSATVELLSDGIRHTVTIKETNMGLFGNVWIPDSVGNRLSHEVKNGNITLYIS